MLDVPRCGEEDESLCLARLPELRYDPRPRWQRQLGPVAPCELGEALRFVSIPLAQFGTGRGVLDTFIVIIRALRLPTGPQPVDEHSILVALTSSVIVDADNSDVALHDTHWFPIHSDETIRWQYTALLH